MTLVGLDYLGKQEVARHNRAQEQIAVDDRLSRESVAKQDRLSRESVAQQDRLSREMISSLDRSSRENVAYLDRSSRETIASADRYVRQYIADLDRQARESIAAADRDSAELRAREKNALDRELGYYASDARIIGNSNIKNLVSAQLAKERFLTGQYSTGGGEDHSTSIPKVTPGTGTTSNIRMLGDLFIGWLRSRPQEMTMDEYNKYMN